MMFTKSDSLRGLKRKDRLRPGQHARKFIRSKGRIGLLWEPFRQKALTKFFNESLSAGERPTVTEAGWEVLDCPRRALENESPIGQVWRRADMQGRYTYKSPGSEVGHKVGHNVSRQPEARHDINAVELQSFRYNRFYEPTHRTKSGQEDQS